MKGRMRWVGVDKDLARTEQKVDDCARLLRGKWRAEIWLRMEY
jgi:hypothetical protein